ISNSSSLPRSPTPPRFNTRDRQFVPSTHHSTRALRKPIQTLRTIQIVQDRHYEYYPASPAAHRQRTVPQGELEAASTLRLGADQHTHTLSLSEARLVIHKVLENKRRGGNKYEEPENLTKTLDYLDVFARFKDEENIKAVERLLNSHTELEILCCDNAEEAKSLIPSLQTKISDSDLQELLDELTKLRNFTE
ncbi:hypothetical protein N7540_003588, partial [Penicillium herquei]